MAASASLEREGDSSAYGRTPKLGCARLMSPLYDAETAARAGVSASSTRGQGEIPRKPLRGPPLRIARRPREILGLRAASTDRSAAAAAVLERGPRSNPDLRSWCSTSATPATARPLSPARGRKSRRAATSSPLLDPRAARPDNRTSSSEALPGRRHGRRSGTYTTRSPRQVIVLADPRDRRAYRRKVLMQGRRRTASFYVIDRNPTRRPDSRPRRFQRSVTWASGNQRPDLARGAPDRRRPNLDYRKNAVANPACAARRSQAVQIVWSDRIRRPRPRQASPLNDIPWLLPRRSAASSTCRAR
jgi:hypothetical protein